jgi:hypothetical protein
LQGGEPILGFVEKGKATPLRQEVGQLRDIRTTRRSIERGPQRGSGYRLQEMNSLRRHVAFRLTE